MIKFLWDRRARLLWILIGVVVAGAAVLGVRHLLTRPPAADPIATEAVSRQDIAQTVEATGTVRAIDVVEIKSKASGEIL